jgi:bacterial/archaeal transporter family protein
LDFTPLFLNEANEKVCIDFMGRIRHGRRMNWIHWSLLSAFFAGLTAILAKVGVTGVDSNLATAVRTTVILFFAWSIAFATTKPAVILEFSGRTWLFLALSGVATGLSWLCYFRALQLGDASRVAPIDKLSVVFVIVLAAFFLKEKMTLQHLLGGVLIVSGAVVLAWKSGKA